MIPIKPPLIIEKAILLSSYICIKSWFPFCLTYIAGPTPSVIISNLSVWYTAVFNTVDVPVTTKLEVVNVPSMSKSALVLTYPSTVKVLFNIVTPSTVKLLSIETLAWAITSFWTVKVLFNIVTPSTVKLLSITTFELA